MKSVIIACAVLLWAGSANAGHTAGVIKGRLVGISSGSCGVGYSAYCPSGACECDEFVGTIAGNPIGKGSADVLVTVDYGAEVSPGGAPTCYPLFAVLEISTSRDHETIDATGTSCDPVSGSIEKITGGFGIDSSDAGASGWGSLTATVNLSTGTAVMRYSGTFF